MQHRRQPRLPHPGNERVGRPWAAFGALLAVLFAGLVGVPGCLNPRPEEDPSLALDGPESDVPGMTTPVERESCEDNPFLAGCEPPGQGIDEGAAGAPPAAEESPPRPEPADAGAPAPGDAGDAGPASSPGPAVGD